MGVICGGATPSGASPLYLVSVFLRGGSISNCNPSEREYEARATAAEVDKDRGGEEACEDASIKPASNTFAGRFSPNLPGYDRNLNEADDSRPVAERTQTRSKRAADREADRKKERR